MAVTAVTITLPQRLAGNRLLAGQQRAPRRLTGQQSPWFPRSMLQRHIPLPTPASVTAAVAQLVVLLLITGPTGAGLSDA